jgi:GNAT superfamily N-acetyltransferase
VLAELVNPEDILFLMHRTRSIGFAWLRWPRSGVVELEPFGIIKSYQGRGLGRLFLEKVLAQAASLGAERMELGVWQENDRAIQLYQRAEFRQVGQTIYLAYSVESKAQMS